MNETDVVAAVKEWLEALAASDSEKFGWAASVRLDPHPAFLAPAETTEGDEHLAGWVAMTLITADAPSAAVVDDVRDWIVRDGTLNHRVKAARFEYTSDPKAAGIIVALPA